MSNALEVYDRNLDLTDQVKSEWQGLCPICKSQKLMVHPIGVSYQSHTITDYSDLPQEVAKYYRALPNVVEAVMLCLEGKVGRIVVECLDCKTSYTNFFNERPNHNGTNAAMPNQQKLLKYLEKFYGVETVMRLGEDYVKDRN